MNDKEELAKYQQMLANMIDDCKQCRAQYEDIIAGMQRANDKTEKEKKNGNT